MKKTNQILMALICILLTACSSEQSLQEYYVASSENPNFLSFDIPASILNLKNAELSVEQRAGVASLKKLDILAFKKTTANDVAYQTEKTKVKGILKNEDFTELMKMNTPYGKATVKYLGEDDAIDEVIIYGDNEDKGFALIRILGNDMNPAHLMQLLQAIQKSDYNGGGLEQLEKLFQD